MKLFRSTFNSSFEKKTLFFLLIFIISFFVFGIVYFNHRKEILTKEIYNEFSAVAGEHVAEITEWFKEKNIDAGVFQESNQFKHDVINFLRNPQDISNKNFLTDWLVTAKKRYDYEGIFLISTQGKISLTVSEPGVNLPPLEISKALSTLETDIISHSNFWADSLTNDIYLSYRIPLISKSKITPEPIGVLILVVDPDRSFFPAVQSLPLKYNSAECYLVRRDSSYAVYLSPLKFIPNAPLLFRKDITDTLDPAVIAARSKRGIYEGIDYRKMPVLADIRKVPGTDWFMITQADQSEIYEPIYHEAYLIFAIVLSIIIIAALIFYQMLRDHRARVSRLELERKLEQQALMKHFEYLEKYGNDIILLSDMTHFIGCNDAAISVYGYTKEEFLKLSIKDLRASETLNEFENHFSQFLKDKRLHIETIHVRKNGEKFPVEVSARLIEVGGKTVIQSVITDITERKNYQTKLEKLNRVYAILSNINQLIVRNRDRRKLFDEACRIAVEDGKFLMATIGIIENGSEKVKIISKYGIDNGYTDQMNITLAETDYGKGPAGVSMRTKKFVVSNDIANDPAMAPWRERANKNGYRSMASFPLIVFNKAVGFIAFYSGELNFFTEDENKLLQELAGDISFSIEFIESEEERKKSLYLLRESEEKFSKAFINIPDGIAITRLSDGKIIEVNQKFLDALGYSKEEVIGKTVLELNCWHNPEERENFLKTFNDKGEVKDYEANWRKRDSTIFPILISSSPLDIKSEKCIISVAKDITEKKIAEQELIKSKEKAEEMSRLKSSFLAIMSHELRTPLIGILGFSELLESEVENEDSLNMVRTINSSGKRLLRTLNQILNISKVESEKYNLNLEKCNVVEFIKNSKQLFEAVAAEKGLLIELKLPDDAFYINADKDLCFSILDNLLNNAVKFTEKGKITVSAKQTGDKTIIEVQDTGIGISEKDQEIIFEEFRQASEGLSRKFEGTGLGLTIVKKYTEAMGGTIKLKSKVGEGSTFTLEFPLAKN